MLLGAFWTIVIAWLAVCVSVQGYYGWLWSSEPTNPLRHEAMIGIVMATIYALPALAGLGLLRWHYWKDSPAALRYSANFLTTALLVLFGASFI